MQPSTWANSASYPQWNEKLVLVKAVLCGWGGNCLASHTLCYIHLQAQWYKKEMSIMPTFVYRVWHLYIFLLCETYYQKYYTHIKLQHTTILHTTISILHAGFLDNRYK